MFNVWKTLDRMLKACFFFGKFLLPYVLKFILNFTHAKWLNHVTASLPALEDRDVVVTICVYVNWMNYMIVHV